MNCPKCGIVLADSSNSDWHALHTFSCGAVSVPLNERNIRRQYLPVQRTSTPAHLPVALPSTATVSAQQYFGITERFNVILADPPWRYETGRTKRYACAEHHYDTMSMDEIFAMPVGELAAADCVCLIWATSPKMPEAIETMRRWGFNYKTIFFTWIKTVASTGEPIRNGVSSYTRAATEYVIVGTRKGTLLKNLTHPERKRFVQQVIMAPRSEHSRKPIEAIQRIDAWCRDGLKKIELFAREPKGPDWAIWGNEVNKFTPNDDDDSMQE